tara:strand:- start:132 stop:407 length:276 start_codon:yes stop_codon:yes gene_type:complete
MYQRPGLQKPAILQADPDKPNEGIDQVKQMLKTMVVLATFAFPSFAQELPRPAKVITLQEQAAQIVRRYPGIPVSFFRHRRLRCHFGLVAI